MNDSKRLRSLTLAMAITGLALVGSAGAFSHRFILGGSVQPLPPLAGRRRRNGPQYLPGLFRRLEFCVFVNSLG